MNYAGSAAENYVSKLCRNSFLTLWSYQSPRGKNNNELCDVLVVCDNNVIIFSIKDITFNEEGEQELNQQRWEKKAIDSSIKQIYGAEKWISKAEKVTRKDGTTAISFPKSDETKFYRVAVAFGSKNDFPLKQGNYGKGFVHIFNENSLNVILYELDTIVDFIEYLEKKEGFLSDSHQHYIYKEENLLALYMHRGRVFPFEDTFIVSQNNLWKQFVCKPQYQDKKTLDKHSYVWDNLIETFCNDTINDNLEFGSSSLNDIEQAIRVMALESRFGRRILGMSFTEFMILASEDKVRARMLISPNKVGYVFVAQPQSIERRYRIAELGNRCFIARGSLPEINTVVGIATEIQKGQKGFSLDLFYFHQEDWSEQDQARMEKMKQELDFFQNPRFSEAREDEYPPET